MNRPNNLHLSGKFLNLAIEAIRYRINSMQEVLRNAMATDEALAAIDYGNDLPILEGILADFALQQNPAATTNGPEPTAGGAGPGGTHDAPPSIGYEPRDSQLDEAPTGFSAEYLAYHQALSEVCQGACAIDEWEFHALMGVEKTTALEILANGTDLWANRYTITKSSTGLSLYSHEQKPAEGEKTLFSFEAATYDLAMAIRNQFLGFAPYVPFSETLVATRALTLFDKHKNLESTVDILVYQPVQAQENSWLCEYHINVYNASRTSCKNLGGRQSTGYDPLQAVQKAFHEIGEIIRSHNDRGAERIYWRSYGDACGFENDSRPT